MNSSHLFQIKTITNLHVGSGDYTYSAIDNTIQRDPTTEIPIIQPSSLKGALREHCVDKNLGRFNYIFGSEDNAGEYRFLQAEMLAMPLRTNKYPYVLGLTVSILESLHEMAQILKNDCSKTLDKIISELKKHHLEDNTAYLPREKITEELLVEDLTCKVLPECAALKNFLGYDHIALFNDKTFKNVTAILPVIARNKIDDDGTSENLFYEEVVPRKSLFTFFVITPDKIDPDFYSTLTNTSVQIGANASIGYGLTAIKELRNE